MKGFFNLKKFLPKTEEEGFSLLELVIVIAVLAILAILGGPYFLRLINLARFESAKNHLRDSFTSCINEPNASPYNPYIPGVTFQSSNCSNLMSATIDNSCTISMDMSTGVKTGWAYSYETCSNVANGSNNNSDNSNDSNRDSMAVNSPQRDSNGNLIVNDIKVWNMGNCQAVYGEVMKEDPSKKANEYPNNFQTRYVMLSPEHPSAKEHYASQAESIQSSNSQPCKTVKAPLEAFGGVKPEAWAIPKRYEPDGKGGVTNLDPNHQNYTCNTQWCGAYNYFAPHAAFDGDGNPIIIVTPGDEWATDNPEGFRRRYGFEADFSTLGEGLSIQ